MNGSDLFLRKKQKQKTVSGLEHFAQEVDGTIPVMWVSTKDFETSMGGIIQPAVRGSEANPSFRNRTNAICAHHSS